MAKQIIYPRCRIIAKVYRKMENETMIRQVSDGEAEVFYEVSIESTDIECLARKAFRNKNGKSKAGPVSVRIIESMKL